MHAGCVAFGFTGGGNSHLMNVVLSKSLVLLSVVISNAAILP